MHGNDGKQFPRRSLQRIDKAFLDASQMLQSSMSLDTNIRRYFWDIDPDNADPKKHPKYYVSRILEFGNKKAINWLFRMFGRDKVKKLLPTLRLSERSTNYWHYYFSKSE